MKGILFDEEVPRVIATSLICVEQELRQAREKFGPFNSAHEGYAVILEELDELWEAVRRNDVQQQHDEAIQVAAMALRFLVDITWPNTTGLKLEADNG